jgi:hypothetical protein
MKTFPSIIAGVLFCSIFFVPDENAPLRVCFEWTLWCLAALFICNLIVKTVDQWEKEDADKE